MKKYVVYKHTNRSNGKVYIGITSTKPEKRWRDGRGYSLNEHFYRSIQKYGWDNFEHEILYDNLEELQAKTLEISLIRFYNSTNPDNGYNISTGGEGASGYKHSDEAKEKISKSQKGRKHKPHSNETRKKISESERKQRIICIETETEYESYHDAARKIGVIAQRIHQSCNKKCACKGLHFKKIE